MTWTWTWDECASPEVIDWLYAGAGVEVPAGERSPEVHEVLVALLETTGGLALSTQQPEPVAVAQQLVGEACARVLGRTYAPPRAAGVVLTPQGPEVRAVAVPVVEVNVATVAELDVLPVIGATIARRIVAERRLHGEYSSMENLDARVPGVGPSTVRALAEALSFTPATGLLGRTGTDAAGRLAAVVAIARHSSRHADPVLGALDLALTVCASAPHPATRARAPRPVGRPEALVPVPVDEVEILADDYHAALLGMIEAAAVSVDVCLFHAAVGGPGHPTRLLLGALGDAVGRGVPVRVLLDRDRPSDPYRSTVVNAPAVAFLLQRGVPVRSDAVDRLLHSKVVIVDRRWTVIGSHNWSVGSFDEFDDVSVVLDGAAVAAAQTARFDLLWSAAAP